MKGLFITLEGGDGAGKSTQISNIRSFFEEKGFVVVHTREPGGTAIGEKLRAILLDKNNDEMDPVAEMLIYAASRAQIVAEVIRPALDEGKVVICDRFTDSSVAYQGYGRGLGGMVAEVNARATSGLEPDITFWLDIDPESGKERARQTGEPDRLELEAMDFHYRLYEGYKTLAQENPERIKRIDATKTPGEMKEDIFAHLEKLCAEDRNRARA